jgi:hypothetical protein
VDHRDPGRDRRIVERVARLERVRPVDDHVIAGDHRLDVRRAQDLVVGDHRHVGIERPDGDLG